MDDNVTKIESKFICKINAKITNNELPSFGGQSYKKNVAKMSALE